jgi:hopene-associated glycosyltransferase HpnB
MAQRNTAAADAAAQMPTPVPGIESDMLVAAIAALAVAIWLYLLGARGGFWLCRERDALVPDPPARWPSVAAIVPARNEADCIAASIGSLLAQDYPGALTVILVDDDSDDGTAALARRAAAQSGSARPFHLVASRGVSPGWTGKLWALKQGIDAARALPQPPDYVLLTDADIAHTPDSVGALVARAESGGLVLTSLMAKLRCESLAERSHVPAFVYFFQMLFPFAWSNTPDSATAAAAGGCMLVKADALAQAGGVERIRGALIDDCSLARAMKSVGPIWLGLTKRVHSLRHYQTLDDVRAMISRSAYAQLNYSPVLLAATVLGLALTFLAAPLLALFGTGLARILGGVAFALMALSFQPMLRFYRRSPLWGLALPAIAFAYMLYTLDSAIRYARGQGGAWKGRVQANATPNATP